MTSTSREPALYEAQAIDSRMLGRNRMTLGIVISIVLVSLAFLLSFGLSSYSNKSTALASEYAAAKDACSDTSDVSGELREYISGRIEYSFPSSDTPVRVSLLTQPSIQYSRNSEKPKGGEDDEFTLELRDAYNQTVKSINFVAEPVIYHTDPNEEGLEKNPDIGRIFKDADFHIFLSDAPSFKSFAVLHEGRELEVEKHSANSPCLSVIWPIEDRVLNDLDYISVFFQASDFDGDDLIYNVLHSKYGGNFYSNRLRGKVESEYSTVEIPVASLGSAIRSKLALMVTDGTRTVFTESPIFTVAEPVAPSSSIPINQPLVYQVMIESGISDCTILGTEYGETLLGTSGDDVICGLGGDDIIQAGGGNDIIKAGSGDDTIFAGTGDDTIFGETGNDTIDSGAGDDIARGGNGRDFIKGGSGADRLYGEFGKNILNGGLGDDAIYGGKGNDKMWGGYGNESIYGGTGDDSIWGGAGDDIIRDSQGNDIVYPGQGDNTVTGTNSEDAVIENPLSCLRLGKYSNQTAKPLFTFLFC